MLLSIRVKHLSDDELVELTGLIAQKQAERLKEQERIDQEGCRPTAGFLYNHCATCGRDESEMKSCPHWIKHAAFKKHAVRTE